MDTLDSFFFDSSSKAHFVKVNACLPITMCLVLVLVCMRNLKLMDANFQSFYICHRVPRIDCGYSPIPKYIRVQESFSLLVIHDSYGEEKDPLGFVITSLNSLSSIIFGMDP